MVQDIKILNMIPFRVPTALQNIPINGKLITFDDNILLHQSSSIKCLMVFVE